MVPTDIGLNILAPSTPSDRNNTEEANTQEARAILRTASPLTDQPPPLHTGVEPAVHHLPRLEAGILAANFDDPPDPIDKVEGWVDDNPLAFPNNPQEGNTFNRSIVQVIQDAL